MDSSTFESVGSSPWRNHLSQETVKEYYKVVSTRRKKKMGQFTSKQLSWWNYKTGETGFIAPQGEETIDVLLEPPTSGSPQWRLQAQLRNTFGSVHEFLPNGIELGSFDIEFPNAPVVRVSRNIGRVYIGSRADEEELCITIVFLSDEHAARAESLLNDRCNPSPMSISNPTPSPASMKSMPPSPMSEDPPNPTPSPIEMTDD